MSTTNNKNAAAKTDFLTERISQNENFQTLDINTWAFEKIKKDDRSIKVLELCCGTGKQTKFLLDWFPNAEISCLDISADAVNTVKANNQENIGRMKFFVKGIDEFFSGNTEKFDLVFCSYGLYYARNIQQVMTDLYAALNPRGRLIVMGPHGRNNEQLFDALRQIGVEFTDIVLYSSSTFMKDVVLNFSADRMEEIHVYTVRNRIRWNKPQDVISYWKNSTFYDSQKEVQFNEVVTAQVEANDSFVNDKHIMLIESVKHEFSAK